MNEASLARRTDQRSKQPLRMEDILRKGGTGLPVKHCVTEILCMEVNIEKRRNERFGVAYLEPIIVIAKNLLPLMPDYDFFC
jgi:hypothetical protein